MASASRQAMPSCSQPLKLSRLSATSCSIELNQLSRFLGRLGAPNGAQQLGGVLIDPNSLDGLPICRRAFGDVWNARIAGGCTACENKSDNGRAEPTHSTILAVANTPER